MCSTSWSPRRPSSYLFPYTTLFRSTLPGIDRPAIATFYPTLRGESVMLDLGANIECDAENLVQFALMGDAFARSVLGVIERSEEHTSELQSLRHLVCRLLLEKKKDN